MKRIIVIAALAAMACTAMGGSNVIVVQPSGDTITYHYGGKKTSLPEIQQSFEKANKAMRAIDPNIQAPLDVIALGSTSMEALTPLFVCLKQAGQRYCTLYLSEKYNGETWALQVEINLQLFRTDKADWLQERIRIYGSLGDTNSPIQSLSTTGSPAR